MRVAEEGADIISADRYQEFDTVPYPLATPEDVPVAAKQGESPSRRIVTAQADVRDFDLLTSAVDAGWPGSGVRPLRCPIRAAPIPRHRHGTTTEVGRRSCPSGPAGGCVP
jgi:hypothetical protein